MIWIFNFFFLSGFSFVLFWISKRLQLPLLFHFLPFLLIKFLAGFFFSLVHYYFYVHYSHGDTFAMFKQSVEIAPIPFWKNFFSYDFGEDGSQRATFIIAILQQINTFTAQNYWISNAYFSLLSFTGFWFLGNKIVQLFPHAKYPTLLGFLYLPSTLFWTSGISKECIMLQAIHTLVFICLQINFLWHKTMRWQLLVAGVAFITNSWILLKLKYYYLATLLPVLISFSLANFLLGKQVSLKKVLIIFAVGICFMGVLASFSHKNLGVTSILNAIAHNHWGTIHRTPSDKRYNLLHFDSLAPNLASFIKNFQIAFWEGIARPYLWEEGHFFKKALALERLAILLAIGLSLYFTFIRTRTTGTKEKIFLWQQLSPTILLLVVCNIIYCLSLWLLLAYAAPNIGTLNRLQVGFMPFMMLMCLSTFPKSFWTNLENKFLTKRSIF